ncbi:universal stress protein [Saccharomonospora piscinae]|uniref:universal stress protein n=1 Tax=Saccharomonospora piscinae TaxID=687388 RepID=UPI000467BAC6|nr:universal stress protein [Saccharomonospora piscinae]
MSTVVAAVDGSPAAVNAVRWAATDAEHRGATLRLVHAYLVPVHGYPDFAATFPQLREGMRDQGARWLEEARTAAETAAPEVAVETELAEGEAVPVLLAESHRAELVVLGSRGLGGFTGMLVGSVAVALAAHGHSPVVVVRGRDRLRPGGEPPAQGAVVAGVDGSEPSTAALAFAFAEAELRGAPLVVVRTWSGIVLDAVPRYPLTVDPERIEADERAALAEQVAPWSGAYPSVAVEPVVVRGRPVRTLLEHADRARLVVVGSRGRSGFRGMLLGSTSQALIAHAPCPVAVVRRPAGQD